MKRVLKRITVKRVVLILLVLLVPASSVVTFAAIADFARGRAYEREFHFEQWRAEERRLAQAALAQAQPEAQVPPPQPEAPTRRGRGQPAAPEPTEPPETTVVTTPDGRTVVLSRQQPDAPFETGAPDEFDDPRYRARDAFRLGQDLTVGANEIVRDAAVVFGNANVSGRVVGNLVVFFGTANIASTAVIEGDFVSVGGAAKVQPGASVERDVVVIGGPLEAPAGFAASGGQIVIGTGFLGNSLNEVVPYLARGPMWGRVIVPDLPWVWGILSLVFLVYAALNLIFDRPVLACATKLRARPVTAFGSGLLVLLLVGPVCVLLAVSIIGIAVVPFVIFALIAGGVIGKVAVARWIGMSAVAEDPEGSRAHGARSFVIGFAVLAIAYMIPVVGIIVWGITGVLGLGSAALAFMAAYRRENPAKPPVVAPPPSAPPAPIYTQPTTPVAGTSAAFDASAAGMPTAPPPFEPAAPPVPAAVYAGTVPVAASGLLVAQPRALFRDRLAAFVIDVLLVGIFAMFLDGIGFAEGPVFFPMLLVYYIAFWTWRQTTMGGIICQIRLVKTDGTALTFADALVRGLAGIFSLAVLAIGALWILRDPEQQAWHDKIAGTYVVKVPRNWPL